MSRRILYYHTIMARDEGEITKQVVLRQSEIKGDFFLQVQSDMRQIDITDNDITNISNSALKGKVDKGVSIAALQYLKEIADKHSKVRGDLYTDMKGMEYFSDHRFSPDLANLLFKFRTRMFKGELILQNSNLIKPTKNHVECDAISLIL